MSEEPQVTFVSCFYVLKSKFPKETYFKWLKNFLGVEPAKQKFYLVIFCDSESAPYLQPYSDRNPRIKLILKPLTAFYNYKYAKQWQSNHAVNLSLNKRVEWQVNMLWAEKVHFVAETLQELYYPKTVYYSWCDIGYFRDGPIDPAYPRKERLAKLNPSLIYYACINSVAIPSFAALVNLGKQLPTEGTCIAGGYYITHAENVLWWLNTFDAKLQEYFLKGWLVKDDQVIIASCVFNNKYIGKFCLTSEKNTLGHDIWFQFRRHLL